eukprot:GILK01002833.1.p1 GENE.GILK01002833.1~~GILK01002833.1.p1  ORF type:complete len:335 (-),score=52.69 GILK01002833.1:175-1179(-)
MKLVVLLAGFLVCVSVVEALALRSRDKSSYVCTLSELPESPDPYPSILRKAGFQREDIAMVKNTDLPVDRWVFSLNTIDNVPHLAPLAAYFKSLSFRTLSSVSHYGHAEMSVDILLTAVMLTIGDQHQKQMGKASYHALLDSEKHLTGKRATHLTDLSAATLRDSSAAFMVFNLKGFNKARVKAIKCRWRLLIQAIQARDTEAQTASTPPCIPRFDVTVAQAFTREEQQEVVPVATTISFRPWAEWLHYADWELAMLTGYPHLFDATVFVVPDEDKEEEEAEEVETDSGGSASDGGHRASTSTSGQTMKWKTVSQVELEHTYGIKRPERSPCDP